MKLPKSEPKKESKDEIRLSVGKLQWADSTNLTTQNCTRRKLPSINRIFAVIMVAVLLIITCFAVDYLQHCMIDADRRAARYNMMVGMMIATAMNLNQTNGTSPIKVIGMSNETHFNIQIDDD